MAGMASRETDTARMPALRCHVETAAPIPLRLALASMGQPNTKVSDLCAELGITRQTLYRHVSPTGELRPDGEKLLSR